MLTRLTLGNGESWACGLEFDYANGDRRNARGSDGDGNLCAAIGCCSRASV